MNHISHKILYIYDSAWDEVRLWDTPKLIKPDDEHWNLYPTEKEVRYQKQNLSFNLEKVIIEFFYSEKLNDTTWK